jgi:signal transduction histidine kinase
VLRLFLRLYLLLMLPATLAFVLLMFVTDEVMTRLNAEQQRARAATAFERAERIITDKRVPDWRGRLKLIEQTFNIEHKILPLAEARDDWFMSEEEKERLEGGHVARRDRLGGGGAWLRRMKDSDQVIRIEWVGFYQYLGLYYTIIIVLMTLALCAILYRWAKPMWHDVQALQAATARVGGGDFDVRAEVARTSLLEPIASAFNGMSARVHALLRSHRDLEQSVAHELRTPLAQLKFDLELARTAERLEDREARFADMRQDVAELESLVDELLVLANLRQAPPYEPRETPTRALLDDVLRRANDEMRATGRSISIEGPAEVPESVSCDAKYLGRALANVLRNAVRYARSRVALSVERIGNRTVIRVDDDGPGVPPDQRQRIFEPFTRVEGSRGRDSGGVGLGLAIVKSVAEWHGGEARISDSPLGGARVSISW